MEHGYVFEWLLAILSINTWIKLLIRMQMTEAFGPQFKIIFQMGVDLVKFYALWAIILLMLTSVGCLVFMDVPGYDSFLGALYMHWDFALGAFDSSIYCPVNDDGKPTLPEEICVEGKIFLFVFNSLNVVLLLNLIIAIMGSVYGMFEEKTMGLYYEVIIGKFCVMEYDHRYGAAACAQPPMNMMIFPLQWILIFSCYSDDFLRAYNEFLCHLLYLPLAILFTLDFLAIDIVSIPFAYFMTLFRLLRRLFKEDKEG